MALLLTLVMVLLLSLEVAMISLIALRGLGDEGALHTRNTAARRAAEVALNRLNTKLTHYLTQTGTPADVDLAFTSGQAQAINSQTLTLDNPDSGTSNSPVTITAYVKERRGNLYHLIGRATDGSVDLVLHRWIHIQPCLSGLVTIMSDRYMTTPNRTWYYNTQYPFVMTDTNGRVFFGENSNTGKFWTWSESTGLSTIVTGEYRPGSEAMAVASDGRVFFGEPYPATTGSFWTWKDGVLSTIVSSMENGTYGNHIFVGSDGRVAFSEYNQSWVNNKGKIWTWKDGILTTIFAPSGGSTKGMGVFGMGPDGRVYYTADYGAGGRTYYWLNGSPPTTGLVLNAHVELARVASDGRIMMQRQGSPAYVFSWKPGDGSLSSSAPTYTFPNGDGFQLGTDSSNNFYMTSTDNSSTDDYCIVATGIGTTSIRMANGAGTNNLCYPLGGFSQVSSKVYLSGLVWDMGSSTSVKYLSGNNNLEDVVVDSTGRVFGMGSNGFLSWKNGTLSTVVSGAGTYGERAVALHTDGRVFFGQNDAAGSFYTWKEGSGLSTLASGNKIGYFSTAISNGRVFFGEVGTSAKFWTWKESNCNL